MPHTEAKHGILKGYLQAWIPILSSNHRRIVIVDGFSGPGEYKGGEPGSPVMALDVAKDHVEKGNISPNSEVVFVFIEERSDRAAHLEGLVKPYSEIPQLQIHVENHEFNGTFSVVLDDLRKVGKQIAPTFVFADPFGFKGLPMRLLHRVLSYDRTEIFANLAVDSVNRFLEHPEEKIRKEISRLIGVDVQTIDLSGERIAEIRRLYQLGLEQKAQFVRSFKMLGLQ